MNTKDLIKVVSEEIGFSKADTEKTVNAIFGAITAALKNGDKAKINGFGTFETRDRAARKGRNPQTGEEIEIAASKAPAFKPSQALKNIVKE